jgi:predicted nuclease of restriction endonuclease-like (RecB) superfamily
VNASTKLRKLIRNPKVINDMSLMSEIVENKLDEQSISEELTEDNDID